MAKLTLEDLRKMRGEKQKAMEMRDSSNKDVQVIVGMGTCGIAAGAKDTFTALVDTLSEKGLTNVLIRQTGCMGSYILQTYCIVELLVLDLQIYKKNCFL